MNVKTCLAVLCWYIAVLSAHAQNGDAAKDVYKSSHDSVFLIYINDDAGKPTALGTGFEVAPRTLVTNAHVIESGKPFLAVGPVRIPAKITQIDKTNDLAILTVDVDLTGNPLPLSSSTSLPGEQILAIGNPEGLEQTISQGIVSAIRRLDDKTLIQITSPISHGSSGGPVMNTKGEVIGVAVGMFESGQNLNFAVPVSYVRALLERKSAPIPVADPRTSLAEALRLSSELNSEQWSKEPESPYQQKLNQATNAFKETTRNSEDVDLLIQIVCGASNVSDELAIDAARKALRISPSIRTHAILAFALSQSDNTLYLFNDPRDTEVAAEGEREARLALAKPTGQSARFAYYAYASILENRKSYGESYPLYEKASSADGPSTCGGDLMPRIYRGAFDTAAHLNRPEEAERWFDKLRQTGNLEGYDWDTLGDLLVKHDEHPTAAAAYEKAAANGVNIDACYATDERFRSDDTDIDALLKDGRSCITSATNAASSESKKYNSLLPSMHAEIAYALNQRGVYSEALNSSKEAINLDSSYAYAYYQEAIAYSNLQRIQECISASQSAIRLSDGKWAEMHFQLGSCYFSAENWATAESSFRKASELNKNDPLAAYNVAACLYNEKRSSEALEWFQETLKRNPWPALKQQALGSIRDLSK